MYEYKCKIIKVVDGDTVDVDIDLGFGCWLKDERVRVMGIDTPESRTSDKVEKIFGLKAKERLNSLLGANAILQTKVSKNGENMKGKFGRILGNFLTEDGSKICADILVQEYGKYFDLKTGIFRGGCLTGPNHSSAELHGFLSYLVNCGIKNISYNIFGYQGKQVRDNLHSSDLVNMFYHFFLNPKYGEIYNVGGQRNNSCSIIEAIEKIDITLGIKIKYKINSDFRKGDHKWWITDMSKFKRDYPQWSQKYNLERILEDIYHSSR